jgi:hypothetical protein
VFNLGSSNFRFKDLFLSGNTIDLGGTLITRNESTGGGGGIKVTSETGEVVDTTVRNLFALGNIGIGLSNPQARLDVDGGIHVAGHVVPSVNIAFDLGTSNERFRDLYLSGSTINLGGTLITRHESEMGVGIKVTGEDGARLDVDGGIQVAGHVIPVSNVIYDLGTSNNRFRDLYLSGNTLDLGGTLLKRHVTGPLMVMSEATQSMESIIGRHAYIEGTANACNVIINTNGTGTSLIINQSGAQTIVDFRSLGESVLLVENTGRVGINTSSPAEALHVHGNVLASGDMLASGTITASNLVILGDYVTLDTITSNTEQMVITNDGTGPALIVTQTGPQPIADFYDDGGALALRIADGGNVGIGTKIPLQKLHVNGAIRGTQLISTVATGTEPLTITSTTKVTNLNADLLDDLDSTKFMRTDTNTSTTGTLTGTRFISTVATGTEPLTITSTTKVANLNADMLDGLDSTNFVRTDGSSTISSATDTIFTVQTTNDANKAEIAVYGPAQGTGRVYVGQSSSYGGGLEYNGDNNPSTTGAGADYITLFRRDNNVDSWTARNVYNTNNWEFNGYVSKPNNVYCQVGKNNGDIPINTFIVFNHVIIDNRGIYNTSNGRFTAPIAGHYMFCFTCIGAINTSTPNTRWYKNGAETGYGAAHVNNQNLSNTHIGLSTQMIIYLNAGDYVQHMCVSSPIYGTHSLHCHQLCILLG